MPLGESFGVPGQRVPLPPYPYERSRHWVDPDSEPADRPVRAARPRALPDWFAVPTWQQAEPDRRREPFESCLAMVPADDDGLLADLRAAGIRAVEVRPGPGFAVTGSGFAMRPGSREDADLLVAALGADLPDRIMHAFGLGGAPAGRDIDAAWAALNEGFFSVLHLTQALAAAGRAGTARLDLLCRGTADVTGGDLLRPEHAALAGAVRVLPLEIPGLVLRRIDVDPAAPRAGVVAELSRPADAAAEVALRGGRRWVTSYAQVSLPEEPSALREEGRYLITGGPAGSGSRWPRSWPGGSGPGWCWSAARACRPGRSGTRTWPSTGAPTGPAGPCWQSSGWRRPGDRCWCWPPTSPTRPRCAGSGSWPRQPSAGWTGSCTRRGCPAAGWPKSRTGPRPRRCWRPRWPARSRWPRSSATCRWTSSRCARR